MQTLNRLEFVERHGDPANFTFKGQCYDAGPTSGVKCALCGEQTRFVYLLRDPKDRSTPTGSECFHYFQEWNPSVYTLLEAYQKWLSTTVKETVKAVKVTAKRQEIRATVAQWREVKRKALKKIAEYRASTKKDWLPEDLFKLNSAASKTPALSATRRWYENRIKEIAKVN